MELMECYRMVVQLASIRLQNLAPSCGMLALRLRISGGPSQAERPWMAVTKVTTLAMLSTTTPAGLQSWNSWRKNSKSNVVKRKLIGPLMKADKFQGKAKSRRKKEK